MGKFILKRTLVLIPTLLIILTVVFMLLRMIPGSPAINILHASGEDITPELVEQVEEKLGLDKPWIVQYWEYLCGIFTSDWGTSYDNQKPVFENMVAVWEPSLIVTVYATIITVVIAIPAGIIAATHRNSVLDYAISTASTATMILPSFCVGLLLLYFFGVKLHWFPVTGYTTIARGGFWNAVWNLTLPSVALGLHHVASLARYTRSSMLDVLNQDYIRTARAKGLSRNKVYYKHALKNTLAIVGTMIASSIATMLGGAVTTETVFNIRGMGKLTLEALGFRDYPQSQAIIVFFAMVVLGLDLVMDIFYKILDPRIEYE